MFSFTKPKTFAQATKDPNWCNAMTTEPNALELNNTSTVTNLPDGKKVIGCKWIFKLKFLADGGLDKYKARLVAKGYDQLEGVDFFETFALVAKMTTVRVFWP